MCMRVHAVRYATVWINPHMHNVMLPRSPRVGKKEPGRIEPIVRETGVSIASKTHKKTCSGKLSE